MSNTILRFVVDDISKDLEQLSDDRKVAKSQIAFWTLMVANRLKSQHISKISSGAFLHVWTDILIEKVPFGGGINPDAIAGRKRITLPASIYDFNNDRGIDYISYWVEEESKDCNTNAPRFSKHTFTRTTQKTSTRLYYSKDETPSPSNPFFYRTGNFVYFLGIEKVNAKAVEIGLYSTFDPLTEIRLDDPFDFPEELLLILKRQVLDLGRFALQIPEDRKNDGEDDVNASQIPTGKLVSVNDEVNKTE